MSSQTIAKTDGFVIVLDTFYVLRGGVHKGSNVRKCWLKQIQIYRLEKVYLNAFLECLEIPRPKVWMPSQTIAKPSCLSPKHDVPECHEILRFGCFLEPLQKRTVWLSFLADGRVSGTASFFS